MIGGQTGGSTAWDLQMCLVIVMVERVERDDRSACTLCHAILVVFVLGCLVPKTAAFVAICWPL
jgi:uncharacterized membrane protein (DUF4010 family)